VTGPYSDAHSQPLPPAYSGFLFPVPAVVSPPISRRVKAVSPARLRAETASPPRVNKACKPQHVIAPGKIFEPEAA
jgi:hypothetical protein